MLHPVLQLVFPYCSVITQRVLLKMEADMDSCTMVGPRLLLSNSFQVRRIFLSWVSLKHMKQSRPRNAFPRRLHNMEAPILVF